MNVDGTALFDDVVSFCDEGKVATACQHIGAEVEARVSMLNKIEKENAMVTDILQEIEAESQQDVEDVERIEKEIFGEEI